MWLSKSLNCCLTEGWHRFSHIQFVCVVQMIYMCMWLHELLVVIVTGNVCGVINVSFVVSITLIFYICGSLTNWFKWIVYYRILNINTCACNPTGRKCALVSEGELIHEDSDHVYKCLPPHGRLSCHNYNLKCACVQSADKVHWCALTKYILHGNRINVLLQQGEPLPPGNLCELMME